MNKDVIIALDLRVEKGFSIFSINLKKKDLM